MLVAVFSAPKNVPSAGLDRAAAPRAPITDNYRRGVEALRRSQPFRALLATFVLQGLATGIMLAGAQYIAKYVLLDKSALTFLFVALIAPALVCAPLWGLVARRTGKERAFAMASILFGLAALSLVGQLWAPGPWIYGPVALAGAAYAGMQSLPMAMLPVVISHDAQRNGSGKAGTFGGVWTAGETAGMAFGTTVLTIVLAISGYLESVAGQEVTQSPTAIAGIVLSFSVVPAAVIGLSLITLARYPLRKKDIDPDAALAAAGGVAEPVA
jgi:Na+/melibiose symporter-like transporter